MQIGKVNLDLTHYPGEDLYCDGEVENKLLHIARDFSTIEYPKIIEQEKSWEVLYHFSSLRENIVEWVPLQKTDKVLEVGSGCGAITGVLSRKAGSVTCIDLSQQRSKINAYRNMEQDNIDIKVGNFEDIEPDLPDDYDYIMLIGVFEYGQAYIHSATPFDTFLQILKKHLKPEGRIIIAIENRLGLKYWAGCREDHLGTYFSGLEGYPEGGVVRTFSKNGLEEILKRSWEGDYSFYYPYPDYKFMTTLYSDEYLPKVGELSNNMRNFDRDRMVLFDEKQVFDSLTRDNMFPDFSNSFLVVLGPKLQTIYARYSNDREPEFQIRTDILQVEGERRIVRKSPLTDAAVNHVEQIDTAYQKLRERYQGGELKINRCRLVKVNDQAMEDLTEEEYSEGMETSHLRPYVELEYLKGISLAELMDDKLKKEDLEGFMSLFRHYVEILDYHSEMPVADFDLIFSNIILTGKDYSKPFHPLTNATWTLIDYEWTFGKVVPIRELAFRAAYCYMLEDSKRKVLNLDLIQEELGISEKEADEFREQEKGFQRYVTGNRKSMTEMRDLIGFDRINPVDYMQKMATLEHKSWVQIYENRGEGFSEETAYWATDVMEDGDNRNLLIRVDKDVLTLRLDPALSGCMVVLRGVRFNDQEVTLGKDSAVTTNGIQIGAENAYIFTTKDPNITIDIDGIRRAGFQEEEIDLLEVEWEISLLGDTMMEILAEQYKPKRRFWR